MTKRPLEEDSADIVGSNPTGPITETPNFAVQGSKAFSYLFDDLVDNPVELAS